MNSIFKNNFLYHLYFRNRYITQREKQEKTTTLPFYKHLFQKRPALIFDIGANHGDYAYVYEKLADKVVCLEPDLSNYEFLKLRFWNNAKVVILNSAVGEAVDIRDFFVVNDGSGLNTLSEKRTSNIKVQKKTTVHLTTLDRLIEQYGNPDYIKIDVEGYEINVLKGLSKKVKTVSFEANLPDFLNETFECIDHLTQIGACAFNYEYSNELKCEKWVGADEIKQLLKKTTSEYANVFCRFE